MGAATNQLSIATTRTDTGEFMRGFRLYEYVGTISDLMLNGTNWLSINNGRTGTDDDRWNGAHDDQISLGMATRNFTGAQQLSGADAWTANKINLSLQLENRTTPVPLPAAWTRRGLMPLL